MNGTTVALVEGLASAVVLAAGDTALQALTNGGLNALDPKQIASAALIGGLTYLVGFLRGLPLAPNGKPLPVAPAAQPAPPSPLAP